MAHRRLYDYPRSGNCYKVRLLLALLGLDYQRVPVDIAAGEAQDPAYLALNPRGQVPLLADVDGTRVRDSMAILVYLARRYGDAGWLPTESVGEARVMEWLAVAGDELLYGLARARQARLRGRPFDLEQCQAEGRAGLDTLETRLAGAEWLVGEAATIADIACYPYVALADEAGLSLAPYPGIRAWLRRVEGLPGWRPLLDPAD